VKVTAPSNAYGTSTPGVFRLSERWNSTRYRLTVIRLLVVGLAALKLASCIAAVIVTRPLSSNTEPFVWTSDRRTGVKVPDPEPVPVTPWASSTLMIM
jgi:hypothetical protein